MKIKTLLYDDDAVSPVIGVILMVAITVILAAVIATFVLGLGDSVSNNAPQASFSFDYDSTVGPNDHDAVNVTHDGGDDLALSELQITIGGTDTLQDSGDEYLDDDNFYQTTEDDGSGDNAGASVPSNDPMTAGETYTIVEENGDISDGQTVRVIWSSPDDDSSATIGQSTVDL